MFIGTMSGNIEVLTSPLESMQLSQGMCQREIVSDRLAIKDFTNDTVGQKMSLKLEGMT